MDFGASRSDRDALEFLRVVRRNGHGRVRLSSGVCPVARAGEKWLALCKLSRPAGISGVRAAEPRY